MPPCGGIPERDRRERELFSFKSCPRVGASGHFGTLLPCPRVSSRAPVWGASWKFCQDCHNKGFKSCPRVGASCSSARWFRPPFVSSRAPVWGHPKRRNTAYYGLVSSRAPVWGGILYRFHGDGHSWFQVVPPCGGIQAARERSRKTKFQVVPPCGGIPALVSSSVDQLFQVVPPCGGILQELTRQCAVSLVSSRAPCGGHRRPPAKRSRKTKFQVVPPCGGIHRYKLFPRFYIRFKSCPRVGGHPVYRVREWFALQFQVVPPCGGHLVGAGVTAISQAVSSRAPVWGHLVYAVALGIYRGTFQVVPPVGASCQNASNGRKDKVSSRAPRVGGIGRALARKAQLLSFKSCPRVGGIWRVIIMRWGDEMFQVVPPCGGIMRITWNSFRSAVSSRAPVWGASRPLSGKRPFRGFKSSPRVGSILIEDFSTILPKCFKSCPRVGASRTTIRLYMREKFQVVPPCGGHPPAKAC